MIDYKKAEKEFRQYLKNYDLNEGIIKSKVNHTYGVVSLSEYIARDLNLSEEDMELDKLIALLHDIARFEQAKIYGDYRDYKNIDHAELAIKILFEDNLIRNYIVDDSYDSIILKAIKNHNKLKIEDGLNEEELLHSKIIRDADKTDNFRVNVSDSFEDIFHSSKEKLGHGRITEKIYNDFLSNKMIVSKERTNDLDCWISCLAFIYDYNFLAGLKYIKEKNYINICIDRIDYQMDDTKNKIEEIRKHAINYLEDRLCSHNNHS